MDNSKYADLFEQIYGWRPKKMGQSYEMLVAIAIKLVMPDSNVKINQFIRGEYSNEKYQLDAVVEYVEKTALEAKDYSLTGSKVGRPDVSKLAGALNDLNLNGGIVASPTGFTRHAKSYANGTQINPNSKTINLFNVRTSTKEDENERIMSLNIQILIESPDYQNAKWTPVFTHLGMELLKKQFGNENQILDSLDAFYREDGTEIITFYEFTYELNKCVPVNGIVKGKWLSLKEQAYIKLKNHLIPIQEFKYEFGFALHEHKIEINPNGKAILIVKSEDGKIDKLITETDLRKITLLANGEE